MLAAAAKRRIRSRELPSLPPALKDPWPMKAEAVRIFMLADVDRDGFLNIQELSLTLKQPRHVMNAMEAMNYRGTGRLSLQEWLIAQKKTFDRSEAACRTSLKQALRYLEQNGIDTTTMRSKTSMSLPPLSPTGCSALADEPPARVLSPTAPPLPLDPLAARAFDHLAEVDVLDTLDGPYGNLPKSRLQQTNGCESRVGTRSRSL